MSRKRKKQLKAVLRTFYVEQDDGSIREIKVTGHPRNQSHLKDPNLPAEGTLLKLRKESDGETTETAET